MVFESGNCPSAGSNPAMPAATPASSRPMTATIAPIAAGGNMTSSQPVPAFLTMKETRQNRTPHIMKPPSATSYPNGSNSSTGEINAKLEPRYAGILPLQIKRYSNVPMPLNSRTVAGLMWNRTGTRTVAPNIANRCCKLSGIVCKSGGLSLTPIARRVIVFSSECCLLLALGCYIQKKADS